MKKILLVILFIFSCFLFVACNSKKTEEPTKEPTPVKTETKVETKTPVETKTEVPTEKPVETKTPVETEVPTETQNNYMTGEEVIAYVTDLLNSYEISNNYNLQISSAAGFDIQVIYISIKQKSGVINQFKYELADLSKTIGIYVKDGTIYTKGETNEQEEVTNSSLHLINESVENIVKFVLEEVFPKIEGMEYVPEDCLSYEYKVGNTNILFLYEEGSASLRIIFENGKSISIAVNTNASELSFPTDLESYGE